ncbi:hypothetical protein, partial [Rhodoferax sp.]|uniref:hypothetical protein n=1 Tax=Rhodoferax sp. TaxID=50421 RepID=UPI003BB4D5BE
LQLLSTPPHDDAVTFNYGVLAYPDTDFHRANVAPSRAHTRRATARKEEQRRMALRARCWQAHSAFTHQVNPIEAVNARFHAAWQGIQSGQLPFLGLNTPVTKHSTLWEASRAHALSVDPAVLV